MRRPRTPFERFFRDPLEAALLWSVWGIFRILPLDVASGLGGWLAKTIGPHIAHSHRARANIRRAFPEMSEAEVEKVVVGMWENLGRVAGEFPHMNNFDLDDPKRFEVRGREHFEMAKDSGKPVLIFGAHIGNWELGPVSMNHFGVAMASVYREANNPYVEGVYLISRKRLLDAGLIPKGPSGARDLVRYLKEGRSIGMLIDQKMNDGIAVPFFGIDAMTPPALADFARRTGHPVIGFRNHRTNGARFVIEALPPIYLEKTHDKERDVYEMTRRMTAEIESWIREHPDQWLWLHNRWPSETLKKND